MLKGIGCDIIEMERIEKTLARFGDDFKRKTLTSKEIEICTSIQKVAGRFAAKEAIVKALGCGFGEEIGFLDIEILNDERGKPIVTLSEKAQTAVGTVSILISISHSTTVAMAVASVEKTPS